MVDDNDDETERNNSTSTSTLNRTVPVDLIVGGGRLIYDTTDRLHSTVLDYFLLFTELKTKKSKKIEEEEESCC